MKPTARSTRAAAPRFLAAASLTAAVTVGSPGRAAEDAPTTAVAYAPRAHRFSVAPSWTHSFRSDSRSHDALGLTLDYYLTRRFALGLEGALFAPFTTADEVGTRASPLSETQWAAALQIKFIAFRAPATTRGPELYFMWGSGAIATRPVPVFDPERRAFAFRPRLDFQVGAGVRVAVAGSFVAGFEIRDTLYHQALESTEVAATAAGRGSAADPDTWLGAKRRTHAVQTQLALTYFL